MPNLVFTDRRKPVWCVIILGIVAALCAILMIVYAYRLTAAEVLKKLEKDEDFNDVEKFRWAIFFVFLIFCTITILISFMSFGFIRQKNRYFACAYGTLLMPTWMILLTFSIISFVTISLSNIAINTGCKT